LNLNVKTHFITRGNNTEGHHGIPVAYWVRTSRCHTNKGNVVAQKPRKVQEILYYQEIETLK